MARNMNAKRAAWNAPEIKIVNNIDNINQNQMATAKRKKEVAAKWLELIKHLATIVASVLASGQIN